MAKILHPNLPRAPELTIDEVRDLARRTAVETAKEKEKAYELIRETQDLLKQADEILARR